MPTAWVLRAGREDDIRAMYELDLLCFEEPFRFDFRAMRRYVMYRGAFVVVADSDEGLCGFLVVHVIQRARRRFGYLITLDVADLCRRAGLAAAMVASAEAQVRALGVEGMALHVFAGNAPAIAFYESSGYFRQQVQADFYGAGLDAWVFAKEF